MSLATQYPHISLDEDGTPRVDGTRYKVRHLAAEHYHYGWSAEELLRQHPDLRPEQVYAALTWFYDHFAQTIEQMSEIAERVESARAGQSLSRAELLRRRPSQ